MAIRSNFSDQFLTDALPVLEALPWKAIEQYKDFIPLVYSKYAGTGWGAQTSSVAGVGAAVAKSEGAGTYTDSPIQGYDKTYTFTTYSIKTQFSEELIEDDRLDTVGKVMHTLGMGYFQTTQIVAANVFNNGFSDTGPDGLSLFNTAHTLLGGGTYSNRSSTSVALGVAGLRAMNTSMYRMVNDRSINLMVIPDIILVPPELEYTASELINSAYKPGSADNDINTFNGKLNVVCTPFLTSTTAWFGLAKASHELRYYERIAPSVKTWIDDDTGDMYAKIRGRFDVGYSDWRGAWGSQGA